MENNLDLTDTVKMVRNMSAQIAEYSKTIKQLADCMEKENDITYLSEVSSNISNLVGALRLDLLINVPFRAFDKEIKRLKKTIEEKNT